DAGKKDGSSNKEDGSTATRPASPVDQPATPAKLEQLKREARDQAVAWLRDNNAFNAKSTFVAERTGQIDSYLATGDGFVMELGPNLVKSRRPTYLAVHRGQFLALDLAGEQARAYTKPGNSSTMVEISGTDPRIVPPPVRLSELRIENAAALPATSSFSG